MPAALMPAALMPAALIKTKDYKVVVTRLVY